MYPPFVFAIGGSVSCLLPMALLPFSWHSSRHRIAAPRAQRFHLRCDEKGERHCSLAHCTFLHHQHGQFTPNLRERLLLRAVFVERRIYCGLSGVMYGGASIMHECHFEVWYARFTHFNVCD